MDPVVQQLKQMHWLPVLSFWILCKSLVNSEHERLPNMGDSLNSSRLSRSSEATSVTTAKKVSKRSLVASCPKTSSPNTFSHIALGSHCIFGSGAVGYTALFLLKVAALEMLRRFSKAKCPFAWRGLQTLQMLCYPPFKWIQRWAPFKGLVEGMQVCSLYVIYKVVYFCGPVSSIPNVATL